MQEILEQLREKGWPRWAISEELGVMPHTITRWQTGERTPTNGHTVAMALKQLLERKRIPKKRRVANPRYPGRNTGTKSQD